jgi:hypothetical protein
MELRCPHKLHGMVIAADVVEFKCDSKFCGHTSGVVVLHRFSVNTGELLETKVFKNPELGTERSTEHGDLDNSTALRSA